MVRRRLRTATEFSYNKISTFAVAITLAMILVEHPLARAERSSTSGELDAIQLCFLFRGQRQPQIPFPWAKEARFFRALVHFYAIAVHRESYTRRIRFHEKRQNKVRADSRTTVSL